MGMDRLAGCSYYTFADASKSIPAAEGAAYKTPGQGGPLWNVFGIEFYDAQIHERNQSTAFDLVRSSFLCYFGNRNRICAKYEIDQPQF